jgi:hypothetical protein
VPVVVGKEPALEERYAYRAKMVGRNRVGIEIFPWRQDATRNSELDGAQIAPERHAAVDPRGGLGPRYRAHAFENVLKQASIAPLRLRPVLRPRERPDAHREHVLRIDEESHFVVGGERSP